VQGDAQAVCEVVDEKYNRVRFYRQTGDTTKPYNQPCTKLYTHPDTGEVERITDELNDCDLQRRTALLNCDTLRAQLAEIHGRIELAASAIDDDERGNNFVKILSALSTASPATISQQGEGE
jgi:hypothetical protein